MDALKWAVKRRQIVVCWLSRTGPKTRAEHFRRRIQINKAQCYTLTHQTHTNTQTHRDKHPHTAEMDVSNYR